MQAGNKPLAIVIDQTETAGKHSSHSATVSVDLTLIIQVSQSMVAERLAGDFDRLLKAGKRLRRPGAQRISDLEHPIEMRITLASQFRSNVMTQDHELGSFRIAGHGFTPAYSNDRQVRL
jgi:hypothetical protein